MTALLRSALSLLPLLAALSCQASQLNALIVIRADAPEPALDPLYAGHFQAVIWPAAFNTGTNRLLSLVSGVDWRGERADATFRPAAGGRGFVSVYYASLRKRGYLAARAKNLAGVPVYAVSSPVGVGSASPGTLLMALGDASAKVAPLPFAGPWPSTGLLVFEADSWGQADDVASRTGGRVLVVELPGDRFATWANFYLLGRGWPAGLSAGLPLDPSTGVPGLVRARTCVSLVLHPERFGWRRAPESKDVAWRWFPFVREGGLVLLVAGMTLLAAVIGLAMHSIAQEKRVAPAAALLALAGLSPAILILAGCLERRYGLDYQAVWIGLASVSAAGASAGLYAVVRRAFPGAHPLLAPSLVGLVACVVGDPTWSLMSGLFGYNTSQTSPEGIGAFVAYLTGVVAFSRGATAAAAWFGRAAIAATLILGLVGVSWWAPDRIQAVLLPLVALACGEGWMRWPWLLILALVPNGRTDVVRHGFGWAPLGCLTTTDGLGAVNLFDYVAFVVYPGLWAMSLIGIYVLVFGSGFVMRQFRLVVRQDPRTKALPWAAASLAALGLFNPSVLPGAVLVAFGALISGFFTAVWTL
ncbi:MAG: hypothetical protein ACYC96_15385 [Fimbriimonadaceae bacterium]